MPASCPVSGPECPYGPGRPDKCESTLTRPPRLTLRQTRRGGVGCAETTPAKRTLRIAHLNPRSLLPSIDDVIDIVTREQIDVMCITESWLRKSVEDNFVIIPGFTVVRQDRKSGRGGGVCIFYRDGLCAERLSVPATGSQLETLWLSFGKGRRAVVGVAYRPPRGAVQPYLDDLRDQLAHVLISGHTAYLLGDLNFDLLRPEKPGVASYQQLLTDLHCRQLVTSPTHRDGSLLDHIIVPETDDTAAARVIPFHSSDHDVVVADVNVSCERQRRSELTIRSTRQLDADALCFDLLTADWSPMYRAQSVDDMWRVFLSVWGPTIDHHMPVKTIKLRHPPCPWIDDNPELRAVMRERDLARAERDRNRCEATEQVYRQTRNAAKAAQCKARVTFFQDSFRNSRQKTWKDIRKLLVSSSRNAGTGFGSPPSARAQEWADELNRHFSSVGPKIATSLGAAAAVGPKLWRRAHPESAVVRFSWCPRHSRSSQRR